MRCLALAALIVAGSLVGKAHDIGKEREVTLHSHMQTFSKSLKNGHYAVRLRTRTFESAKDQGIWWGSSEAPPKEVVSQLDISYKGQSIPVPRSAFCDLANPRDARFKPQDNGMELLIIGGDADDSYRCLISLRNGEVLARRVEDGEFPDHYYQVTKYVSRRIDYAASGGWPPSSSSQHQ